MNGELLRMIDAIHRDRGVDKEVIFQGIESAINMALKKKFNFVMQPVTIDRNTGKLVNDNPVDIDLFELGRIAAQSAKQIITQKIREAEKSAILTNYESKQGDILTGGVMRIDKGNIIVNVGKLEAILPKSEQVPGESFRVSSSVRAMVLEAKKKDGKIKVILSRAHIHFVKRLFELEVPEITEKIVQIKAIAREPGARTKIAVYSANPKVDAIGACVGVRGTRIKHISDELFGERIDIIPWSDNIEEFIANTLRPAEIASLTLDEGRNTAYVVVSRDQYPLAIGKSGQNVRLASKLSQFELNVSCPELDAERAQYAADKAAEKAAAAAAPADDKEAEDDSTGSAVEDIATDGTVPESPEAGSGGENAVDVTKAQEGEGEPPNENTTV